MEEEEEDVFNFKCFKGIIPIVNKEILDIARCIIFSKLKHNSRGFDYTRSVTKVMRMI
jgi:hypothetical protein